MVALISWGGIVLQAQIMVVVVFSQGQLGFHLSCGIVKFLLNSIILGELGAFLIHKNFNQY